MREKKEQAKWLISFLFSYFFLAPQVAERKRETEMRKKKEKREC